MPSGLTLISGGPSTWYGFAMTDFTSVLVAMSYTDSLPSSLRATNSAVPSGLTAMSYGSPALTVMLSTSWRDLASKILTDPARSATNTRDPSALKVMPAEPGATLSTTVATSAVDVNCVITPVVLLRV